MHSMHILQSMSMMPFWNGANRRKETFGWTRAEVLDTALADTIIPERYRTAHLAGLAHYLETGEHKMLGRRIEVIARRKDGREIPVELAVTPLPGTDPRLFSVSLRDVSRQKALEKELQNQASITTSILESMADAVIVTDLSGRIIMINPAGRRLMNMPPNEQIAGQSYRTYQLFKPDGKTLCPHEERPATRAIQGEHVNGWIGAIRNDSLKEDVWVSINARPLIDTDGTRIGAVMLFHDITELHLRERTLAQHARQLREQASLLDITHDAVLARDCDDIISFWNRRAEELYGFTREEAIGQNSRHLMKTEFPIPLEQIRAIVNEKHRWEGELVHQTKSGRKITVLSRWTLDPDESTPCRYLETNTDITQRVGMERAFRQTQENYRLVVESSTEFAIIVTDPQGTVVNWNIGAEKIIGIASQDAIGQSIAQIFTPEDQEAGLPWYEMEKAKETGRAEDIRWHVRKDGSRFWGNGVVMPLWNDDGALHGFTKIMRDQTSQRLADEKTQFPCQP